VAELLSILALSGDEPVTLPRGEGETSLGQALAEKLYFLARPGPGFIRTVMESASGASERESLQSVLNEPVELLQDYIRWHQHMDVLRETPSAKLSAQQLVDALPRLAPRLYSISSSPVLFPQQAHLTVAVVRYDLGGMRRKGLASTWLAERVVPGRTTIPCFAAKGAMRLPADGARDIVMIGPGAGVAPFRAFIQERQALGASGRNWLFYGHRHEATDFYYRDEMEAWLAGGQLAKLSLAWSRDQARKHYVQHLVWEQRDQLWDWLENGATLYLCGEKAHMAADVEAALCRIAVEKRAAPDDPEALKAWIKAMKKEKRFQTDVY
ncbi:MAG: sulfite reductase subunit alpha, partial [Opitutales bacterium]|jgi:sulfite reductase (NADPH) flavoprotein alpha-component